MVYCSLKNDTYYESQADVIEYIIKNENGDIIYSGRSIKSPKTHTNRINVTEKIRNYLFSDLGPGWESGSTDIVRQHINAYGEFSLLNGELLLEKYAFICDYNGVFTGEDEILSDPVNSKYDPRMKIFWTRFSYSGDSIEEEIVCDGLEISFSGKTEFDWEESSTTLYYSSNFEPEVHSMSDWITSVQIIPDSSGQTASTYSGRMIIIFELNAFPSARYGSINFGNSHCEFSEIKSVTLMQDRDPYFDEYLTIEAETDTIPVKVYYAVGTETSYNPYGVEYSVNNGVWHLFEGDDFRPIKVSLLNGDKMRLRAEPGRSGRITQIVIEGAAKLYGNLLSLVYGDSFSGKTSAGAIQFLGTFEAAYGLYDARYVAFPTGSSFPDCRRMFSNSGLIYAPLFFAAESYNNYHCQSMFNGCNKLITVPFMKPKAAGHNTFQSMFKGTKITEYNNIFPTSFGSNAFDGMFSGCTELVSVPKPISGTTYRNVCNSMFDGCTSLTKAPDLYFYVPGITGTDGFNRMFYNCSSLNKIKCLFNNQPYNGTNDWVYGVSQTGTFIKKTGASFWSTGANGIPSGWTVEEVDE